MGQPLCEDELSNSNRYLRLSTEDFGQGSTNGRHRFWCCQTQGVLFNSLVGIAVIANALLIGIEAELGLLGPQGAQWTGFDTDMKGVGLDGNSGSAKTFVQAELEQGLNADQLVKNELQHGLKTKLHTDTNVSESLNLPAGYPGSQRLRSAAYSVCEYFFVIIFCLEMILRFCDRGCKEYCCDNPWLVLDITVVTTGLLDVLLPFVLEAEGDRMAVLPLLRMMRLLRLLKLFQVFQPLRMIGRSFAKAFTVVLQVAFVILVLDFALAVILTSLVGQMPQLWGAGRLEVESWFGSVGRSMRTLFAVQTLDGWSHIVEVLGEVIPHYVLVPVIVLYMMLGCFTVIGLVTSVVTDSFVAAQFHQQRVNEINNRLKRNDAKRCLTELFASYAKSKAGIVSRTELEDALNSTPIEHMLRSIDVLATKHDILKLYDQLHEDPACAGNVKVEHMAEAATSIAGEAQASSVFDLKHRMVYMDLRAKAGEQQAAVEKQEMKMTSKKYEGQVFELKQDVAKASQGLLVLNDQVSLIMTRLDAQSKRQDQERQEQRNAAAGVQETIAALTEAASVQMAAHSNLTGKVDGIACQIAAQSAMHSKVDALTALLGQVAEQVQAFKSELTQKPEQLETEVQSEVHTLESRPSEPAAEPRPSEPAAEPPSMNLWCESDVQGVFGAAPANTEGGTEAKVELSPFDPLETTLDGHPACLAAPNMSAAAPTSLETVFSSCISHSDSASFITPEITSHSEVAPALVTHEPWVVDAHEQTNDTQEQWASFPDPNGANTDGKTDLTGDV